MIQETLTTLIEHIGSIIGLFILLGSVAIIKTFKTKLVDDITHLIRQSNGKTYKSKMSDSIKGDANIYKELSRILFTVKASRIGLYQFHNGSVFSTNNPIWKISNTHEICENGVSTEIDKIQDLKSSLFTQIVAPIVDSKNSEGVTLIKPCRCDLDNSTCSNKVGVYRLDPHKMSNSYAHALLMNRNVKFALISPIINIDNQVNGIVMLEFCGDGFMSELELADNSKLLCDTTSMIAQILDSIEKTG